MFKRLFRNFIINTVENYYNRNVLTKNEYGINHKENSCILSPHKITNGSKIFIGNRTFIGKNSWLEAITNHNTTKYFPEISIGDDVYIGNYACISAIDKISIGNGVLISDYFYTSDHTHGFDSAHGIIPNKQDLIKKGSVIINDNCFIGYRVSIMPGVELGKNCVVGAHSVVTRSFPDNSIVAGSPAILVRKNQ